MNAASTDDRLHLVSNASADRDHLLTVAVAPEDGVGAVLETVEEADARAEYLEGNVAEPRRRALEAARERLAEYEESPENGLVLFAGVVDGDLVTYAFDDLDAPVAESGYAFANEFDIDVLPEGEAETETVGLLVVERGGAALGTLDGSGVTVERTLDSDVPGKTRAGGQSEDRFERRREEAKEAFFETVAEAAEEAFLNGDGEGSDPGRPGVSDPETNVEIPGDEGDGEGIDRLVLGGTDVTVEDFREGEYLDHRLGDLVESTHPVEYPNEQGLRELADAVRTGDRQDQAGQALAAFFEALEDDEEPVAYGEDEVDRALEYDAVDTLLVAAAVDRERREALRERAEAEGGECVVVPPTVDRGEQFVEGFGGLGAVLRFPIE